MAAVNPLSKDLPQIEIQPETTPSPRPLWPPAARSRKPSNPSRPSPRLLTLFLLLFSPALLLASNDDLYPPAPAARAAIHFDGKGFLIDGHRTFIASGSVHYARVPRETWRDILLKLKRSGFNTVETYVFWNDHEPREGQFDFTTTNHNLGAFLDLAHELGLYAIVRVGPYSCAEWANGGFPTWLSFKPGLVVRTANPAFYAAMDPWFDAMLPIVARRQINHGGAVIGVQLENEHPQFWGMGTPQPYFSHLLEKARTAGLEVPLWMSGLHHDHDPAGTIPFDSVGRKSPWMSTELWITWYNHYGAQNDPGYERAPWDVVANGGAGFNIYMFHGGSNFDYWNNDEDTASYDYGTLVGQTGDLRPLYFRLKRLALFTAGFADILADSTNATARYHDFAPGFDIRARTSPAGTLVFLANTDKTGVLLQNGAQIRLAPQEMVPLVLQTPISPEVTITEADLRILGVVHQGPTTTLVTYGEPGDTNRLQLKFGVPPHGHPRASDPTSFQISESSRQPTLHITFPATGVGQLVWKLGSRTFRLLALSKNTADQTWFVDSKVGPQIVVGAPYLGDFQLDPSGAPHVTLDTPLHETPPGQLLVYGVADAPRQISLSAPPPFNPPSRLTAGPWEMAQDDVALAPACEDQSWCTLPDGNPPEMGRDGDDSAYAWYRVPLTGPADPGTVPYTFTKIGDDASFYLDGKRVGTFDGKKDTGPDRKHKTYKIAVPKPDGTHELAIFVSHFGRYKFADYIGSLDTPYSRKGLVGPVQSPGGKSITGWKMKGGEDPADPTLHWKPLAASSPVPTFYRTHLRLDPQPANGTVYRFVTTGLSRGSLWLNGHNLGRYPEVLKNCPGLWLPSCWLRAGDNTLVVFDEQGAPIDQTSIQLEPTATRQTLSFP
jgi:beta-galactosidase